MRRLAAYTLLCCCILLPLTASQEATDGPSWAPTGKLNQFRGYVTPRPLPPNAEFVYSSIWAAWSAWSFCNNGVKIRVRACNTVRGFSCLGKNQEFMPCDTDAMATSSRNLARLPSDYDVVDPYEADRREAMRQLYPDDFAAATEPAQQFHRHRVHAAPKTKTREPIILNRAEGDFSTERRRQIPERPPKVRLAELADEEHRPQSFEKQHSREELGKKPIDNAELSVDDISREHHLSAEQVQIHRQELDAALNTLKNDESPSLQLRDEGFSGDHRLSALDVRPPPKNDVLDITKRIGSAEITDEKPEKFDEELDADGHQDITHSDFAKTAELKTADVAVIGEPSTTTAEPETAAEVLEDDDHFEQFGTRPEIVQPKLNNVIDEEPTPDLVTPSSPEVPEEVHEEITVAETTTTTTTEPSTITIPLATPELVTELVTEAFTEAPTTFEEFSTTVFPPPAIVDISTAVNRHRPVAGNAEFKSFGISKVIPKHSSKQKKSKGFGITGFLLQKSERKRFVHDGSVTKKSGYMPPKKFVHKAAPMKTAFLAKPATTAAPDISPDTLHALDWMLRNISKIAEEGDAAFVRALNFNSQETDNQKIFLC
ncbi:hypothetical protein Q1695_010235 [Nippostrongylus brasiliensis]|nr:hypothetical protein Q1695_010235 [Nippostrongylus brasiliensis]